MLDQDRRPGARMQPGLPSSIPFCFGSSSATRQSWRSRPAVRSTALQPVDAPDELEPTARRPLPHLTEGEITAGPEGN